VRIAALVKQIPAFEEMELGPDGRLLREGLDLEMNPYCRRAVAEAVHLAQIAEGDSADGDNECTFVTLGPPTAEEVLREAIAWAAGRNVAASGVLVTDPAFAGSDTLATARALAAALELAGPFDLVLTGRNSVDADTGQVGPEVAELLGLPFLTGVRELSLDGAVAHARCEHDDGWVQADVTLPAVCSAAERLIDPCKVGPSERAAVPAAAIRVVGAGELGPGPWGQAGSPTTVGEVRVHEVRRDGLVLAGSVEDQVAQAVELLAARGALELAPHDVATGVVPTTSRTTGPSVAVLVEPGRERETRELLGAAAVLAVAIGGHAVAIRLGGDDEPALSSWGADVVVVVDGAAVEEDVAGAVAGWAHTSSPWAVLAPSTAWGREVAGRVAAALGAGLTGDAVGFEARDGRLVAWKPAFGGQLVAEILASSAVQMATVRVGVLPTLRPREATAPEEFEVRVTPRGRVTVLESARDDNLGVLAEAHAVVGVGQGVDPAEYGALGPLLEALGAELGATRKVTDQGWLPRARQIGITGRTIAPRLYVAIGTSGKFNHMVGVRASGTVLAVNPDPGALVFAVSDMGIVADWREVVPVLARRIGELTSAR
jgi:electron transfer flavoprotein alpha subunit